MQSVNAHGKPIQPSKIVCVGRNYVAHIQELIDQRTEDVVLYDRQ